MRVLKALMREPMIMRFITRKMTVPRRIVDGDRRIVGIGEELAIRGGPGGESVWRTVYVRIEGGNGGIRVWMSSSRGLGVEVEAFGEVPRGNFNFRLLERIKFEPDRRTSKNPGIIND